MSVDVRNEHLANQDGWWDGYYNQANIGDDHLKESVDTIFSKIKPKLERNSQCVLLMHDRQFRTNPDGSNPYIEKLTGFIKKCQDKGYKFDVLENYQN